MLYCQNVNGLRSKLCSLKKNLSSSIFDLITLIDTNLSSDIVTSELGLDCFLTYRKDRSPETSSKKSHGGVLVAVNNKYKSRLVPTSIANIECIFVSVNLFSSLLLLGTAYIPPGSNQGTYQSYSDAVDEATSSDNFDLVVLTGDFNQPGTDWSNPTAPNLNSSSQCLMHMCHLHHLAQRNFVRNSRNVLLDLIFTSDHDSQVTLASEHIVPPEDHHPPLSMEILVPFYQPERSEFVPNLRLCNVTAVFDWLSRLSYPSVNSHNVDAVFTSFCQDLRIVVESNCPLRRIGPRKFPRWFSTDLIQLVILKKSVHKQFKMTLNPNLWSEFRRLRRICRELTSICYNNFINNVDNSLSSNPRSFWKYVSSLKSHNNLSPNKFSYNDKTAEDPVEVSNLFAAFFSSIFKSPQNHPPTYESKAGDSISSWYISAQDVQRKCEAVDSSKGAGPDGIPPMVIKYCGYVLAPILTVFFNCFFTSGIFPSHLKSGIIVPIYKSGDRSNVANYRPVVLLSIIGKIFESLVLDGLSFELSKHIIPHQHGFKKGRSTATNLALFEDFVISSFTRGLQVDCIYLDFAKAFDTVSHIHLLHKLEAYGLTGPLLSFIRSYLSNRFLVVRCSSALSEPISVISGVPQGSLLGPFLFTLFINDIVDLLDVQVLLFADDLKLLCRIASMEDNARLQRNLDLILLWCKLNSMDLNARKCVVMQFTRSPHKIAFDYRIGQHILGSVSEVRDLGVYFTPNLHPGLHISRVCAKAYSVLGFIFRSTRGFSFYTIKTLYMTLVRSILEYNSPIWSPYQLGLVTELERVQNRFLRLIGVRMGFRYTEVPINEVSFLLGLPSLSDRRSLMDSVFLFKIVNGLLDCPALLEKLEFHIPRQSRHQQIFVRSHHSTAYHQHSTIPRLMRTGNKFCSCVNFFGCSASVFKTEVLSLLRRNML